MNKKQGEYCDALEISLQSELILEKIKSNNPFVFKEDLEREITKFFV